MTSVGYPRPSRETTFRLLEPAGRRLKARRAPYARDVTTNPAVRRKWRIPRPAGERRGAGAPRRLAGPRARRPPRPSFEAGWPLCPVPGVVGCTPFPTRNRVGRKAEPRASATVSMPLNTSTQLANSSTGSTASCGASVPGRDGCRLRGRKFGSAAGWRSRCCMPRSPADASVVTAVRARGPGGRPRSARSTSARCSIWASSRTAPATW